MVFKQVDVVLQLFQFLIMGLTFVALSVAPYLRFGPFMLGLQMIRDVAIKGVNIFQLSIIDILTLIINSLIYLFLGFIIYKKCERIAKRRGLFGHY